MANKRYRAALEQVDREKLYGKPENAPEQGEFGEAEKT